jgi:glycosyltransferase involved in cell wall biosynthesis
MNIAQVVSTYPPYRGGMGSVAYEYTERLRARGHHVHVFTPRYRRVAGDPPYVHRIPSPMHFGNAGAMPSLAYRLKGFDLIHLHYPFFGGAEPVIARKHIRPEQPLMMTYHHDVVGDGWKRMVFDAHRRVLFPWIVDRVDRILVSSEEYAQHSALWDITDARHKIRVLPFGVDIGRFHPGRDDACRQRFGISPEAPLFLFVGGLDRAHYFKGLPTLRLALGEIADIPWHGFVIGDGDLRASFEATVSAQGCGHRLHFLGSVSEEDKARYYRASDLHVFPSTDRTEAFGLVALEAAATGIPTIASDLPGVREVVRHDETGLLVAPGDAHELAGALRRLLTDPETRVRLGAAARGRVERDFAWDSLMDRLEDVYQEFEVGSSKLEVRSW